MKRKTTFLFFLAYVFFSCQKEDLPIEPCLPDADLGHFEISQEAFDFFDFREYEKWKYLVFKNDMGNSKYLKVRDSFAVGVPAVYLRTPSDNITVACDTAKAVLSFSRDSYTILLYNSAIKFQFSIDLTVTYDQPTDSVRVEDYMFVFYSESGTGNTLGFIRFDEMPSGFSQMGGPAGGNARTITIGDMEYTSAYMNGLNEELGTLVLQKGKGLVAFKDGDGVWWKFDGFL